MNFDSDDFFAKLQTKYGPLEEYGYGFFPHWKRAAERVKTLLDTFPFLQSPGLKLLEIGCGDSMTGFIFSCYGHDVSLVDMDDWRDQRAKGMRLIKVDLCRPIPLESNSFDFIYSYNTFEHLYDPAETLKELIRLCKKGGHIYLDFAPLYASPWGLHAHGALRMPYTQFLFSEEFYMRKIREIGHVDIGRKMETLQPLNKWTVSKFDRLWKECGCEIVSCKKSMHYSYLRMIREYPKAFQGRGLTYEDVTTHTIRIVLKKV